jgi:nucleotide-binding universal stress UspA family protein
MTWRRILVATDFSATARVAQRSAEALALRTGASLVLTHIVEMPSTSYAYLDGVSYPEMREQWVAQARRKLLGSATRSRSRGVRVAGIEVRVGKPWFEILDVARLHEADVVCLGNSGHSRFARLLLGSTAENVIRHSPVPVLVTRSRRLGRLDRVLVPVDFDEGSRTALEVATRILPRTATIEAFHAVAPIAVIQPGFPVELPSRAEVLRELRTFLASVGARRARPGAVVNEDPGQAILRRARSWNADLILLCTRGRTGLAHVLLGSVAERVARYADRPVLILPPRPALALASPGRAFAAVTEAVEREERQRTSRKNGKARRAHPAIPGS